MLTSLACSCVRNGRKISSLKGLGLGSATLSGSQHPGSRLLYPASWLLSPASRLLPRGLTSGGGADHPDLPTHDWENLGSLSADISSRRSFTKSSPELRDARWEEAEEEEPDPGKVQRRPGRRNTPYWYHLQCKRLIQENKLQEALDLFSKDMLQGERLEPDEYNFTVLIGGCGRAKQPKKAFKLYNDMKKRGLEASDATYTALFNACAESPSKPFGLQQALKLEQEIRRINYPLSTITYHALLKVHAITNHLQACLHTLREMLENGHVVTQQTFHYLLMGCLKDKENGFRLALQVWRQMLRSGIHPDLQNYNLLLRTARDCGIGDPALASAVLLMSDGGTRNQKKNASPSKTAINIDLLERQLFIPPERDSRRRDEGFNSSQNSTHLIPVSGNGAFPPPVEVESFAPNLLDVFEGKRSSVISLGSVDGSCDRLALIGGAEGLLEKMEAHEVRPELKTLSLLADMMEPGQRSMQLLLKVAKQHKVKLDVGFFNSAIRRAAKADDMEGAKAVLSVMRQRNVSVDVHTFGCLALGCVEQGDGLQLLKDMEEARLRPNVHIFSALIGRATRRLDYVYLKTILKTMKDLEVWPNEVIIRQLEFASQYPPNYNQYKSRNNYLVQIDGFRGYYQRWLQDMPAQTPEEEQEEQQCGADAALLNTEALEGLTESQRKQRAAARRFYSRNPDKKRRPVSALLQHS